MAQHSTYNAADVVFLLDSLQVDGWAPGDNAIVAARADRGSGLVGMGGSSIFSASNNKSGTITLRLLPTSRANRRLEQKLARQEAGGRYTPFPVSCRDIGNGGGFTAEKCSIQSAPDFSRGDNATPVEWVLWSGALQFLIPNEVD